MHVQPLIEMAKSPKDKGFLEYFSTLIGRMWHRLAQIINGNLEFVEFDEQGQTIAGNLKGYWFVGVIPFANTDFTINFVPFPKETPKGFIIISVNKSTTMWVVSTTVGSITVRSAAADAHVTLFIL